MYWRQHGYAFSAEREVISDRNTPTIAACEPLCTMTTNPKPCNAFQFSDGVCTLIHLQSQDLCSRTSSPGCSDDGQLFVHDADDIFCADNSLSCWCLQDNKDCMQAYACLHSDEAARLGKECEKEGCTGKQCGLAAANSAKIPACGQKFDTCLAFFTSQAICHCTRVYIACTGVAPQWALANYEGIDSTGIIKQCLAQGCTNSDCGPPAKSCHDAKIVRCASDYMVCNSKETDGPRWTKPLWAAGLSDPEVTDSIVRWLSFLSEMPAVATKKGIGSGKMYWELEVSSGTCFVAGPRAVSNLNSQRAFISEYKGSYELSRDLGLAMVTTLKYKDGH